MSFWLIGGAALIWNLFGFIVYYMQVTATPEQLAAQYSPEQVEFMARTPLWATSAFAIAVNAGVLGSLFLLLRKAWAVPLFALSLAAVLLQNINSFVLNDAIAIFGTTPAFIQGTVLLIGIALLLYARASKASRWIA